jgi:hypothetical protein
MKFSPRQWYTLIAILVLMAVVFGSIADRTGNLAKMLKGECGPSALGTPTVTCAR